MPTTRPRRVLLALSVAAAVLTADLGSKAWAWSHLRRGGREVALDGWLRFEFAFNTGSAFGLFRDVDGARLGFIVVTVAALAYLSHMLSRLPLRRPAAFVAVGLFAGGALGNLHDRLFRELWIFPDGDQFGVVDFIVCSWGARTWPAFNLADVGLACGVVLLALSVVGRSSAPAGTHEAASLYQGDL